MGKGYFLLSGNEAIKLVITFGTILKKTYSRFIMQRWMSLSPLMMIIYLSQKTILPLLLPK